MIQVTLVSIIIYEIYRWWKFDDYEVMLNALKSLKGLSKEDKEVEEIGMLFLDNKRYLSYIAIETVYMFTLMIMLLTDYWLVGLLLIIQSVLLHYVNKKKNKHITFVDSLITILIIIAGLILI